MKKISALLSIVLSGVLILAPAMDAMALNAPMSGIDMQGYYNSSGYMPGNGGLIWPTAEVNVAGYNAANNTAGISQYKQEQWCIPLFFGSICNTTNYQKNYQTQGLSGTETGYESSGWGGWYSIGGGWGVQSWISDFFTGNFSGMLQNFAANYVSLPGVGMIAGSLGIMSGAGQNSVVGQINQFVGDSSFGSSGSNPTWLPSYALPTSMTSNDPMASVEGIGFSQNQGLSSPAFAGWTSQTGFGGTNNSTVVPSATCNAGNC